MELVDFLSHLLHLTLYLNFLVVADPSLHHQEVDF